MRETSVLYQQMLRACISARESEDPRLPPPSLATRRHVCVHVVYLARSELCEMGDGRDGRDGRAHGGLPVLSAGPDNQPLSITQGAQVCEKRRSPIELAFSRSLVSIDGYSGSLRIKKFIISCNWILLARSFNAPRAAASLYLRMTNPHDVCFARRFTIIKSTIDENRVETLPFLLETIFYYYRSIK